LGLTITGFALADELGVGVGLVLAGVSFTGGAGGNLTTGGVITVGFLGGAGAIEIGVGGSGSRIGAAFFSLISCGV